LPDVVFRSSAVLLLLALALASTREGIAARLGRSANLSIINKAEALDPSNPNIAVGASQVLADLPEAIPGSVISALEAATREGPNRSMNWALLGEADEAAGDKMRAEAAFQRSINLFPLSPKINWMYANFLIRSGKGAAAVATLRLAIEGDPGLRPGAFDLAWRAGLPADQILAAVPRRAETLSAYLDYLSRTNRLDAAWKVWSLLLAAPEPPDFGAALHYFDSLMYARQVDGMLGVWSDLAQRYPEKILARVSAANLIVNGGFEAIPLNGGFDWRLAAIEGAEMYLDSSVAYDGTRSLCIFFDGADNLDFTHVVQYVPVEPDTAYRFSAYIRAQGITTDSGPRFAIYDPFAAPTDNPHERNRSLLPLETPGIIGTSPWQPQQMDFSTGPQTRLIVVQLRRSPSHKIDNRIGGTLWVDSIALTKR